MFFLSAVEEEAKKGDWNSIAMMIGIVVLLVVVVIVLPMINKRKQQKQYDSLLDTMKIGATVKTIGGIIGKIVEIRTVGTARYFTIETGAEGSKTTMEFDINALYQVIDPTTYAPIAAEAPAKEKKEEKVDEPAPVEEATEEPKTEDKE